MILIFNINIFQILVSFPVADLPITASFQFIFAQL